MNGIDRHSDAESGDSVSEVLTREQINEFDNGSLFDYRSETEQRAVNQRFTEMNEQISEMTDLVTALTEKISSSNRERNVLNTISNEQDTRSDMVTGAQQPTICRIHYDHPLCNTFSHPPTKSRTSSVKSTT